MTGLELLLIDDHALFREGLALQLARITPAVTVQQAADVASVAQLLGGTRRFDLVLLDWSVPGLNTPDLVLELAARDPPVPVVVVSGSERIEDIAAALDAGALGFVPKSLDPEALSRAISLVLEGQVFLPAVLARELAAWRRGAHAGAARPELSARQQEVLALLATGCSNQDIAQRLGISPATVKSHVNMLFNLLAADNRTACVHQARQLGLLA